MGQYYKAINVDKKEFLRPSDFDSGLKLMEFSFMVKETKEGSEFMNAVHSLLLDRWKGDHVYIVGDYADIEKIYDATEKAWLPILEKIYSQEKWLGKKFEENDYTYYTTLYQCEDHGNYTRLTEVNFSPALRFICNSIEEEYVDLESSKHKIQYILKKNGKENHEIIHPLPLLIAMGNGRGGGDYRSKSGQANVGRWVKSSNGIYMSDEKPKGYKELIPSFSEEEHPVVLI